jgi:phage terminase small subunit
MAFYSSPRVLDEREFQFVEHIVAGVHQAEAARLAGYSPKSATVQASNMLARQVIIDAINARRKEMQERIDVSREQVLKELIDIMRSSDKDAARVQAAAQINKMQGYYATEKVEHAHVGVISCVVELPNNYRKIEDSTDESS